MKQISAEGPTRTVRGIGIPAAARTNGVEA